MMKIFILYVLKIGIMDVLYVATRSLWKNIDRPSSCIGKDVYLENIYYIRIIVLTNRINRFIWRNGVKDCVLKIVTIYCLRDPEVLLDGVKIVILRNVLIYHIQLISQICRLT